MLSGDRIDAALLAVANFVGPEVAVSCSATRAPSSELAAAAGARLGLPEPEVRALRRAGLVHGLGRLGVSNSIWDKPGPLGAGEWERVRIHPYLTERMLHQSGSLAPLGAIACSTASGSTAPAIRAGFQAQRSRARRASSARRTPTRR